VSCKIRDALGSHYPSEQVRREDHLKHGRNSVCTPFADLRGSAISGKEL
jgi:hypothetical protein